MDEQMMADNVQMLESLQCSVPRTSELIELTDSVIIKDEYGCETIIGQAARNYSPEGTKRRGGNPKQLQYRNLLRGAVAMLGEGEHVFNSIAFSTAEDSIQHWREKKGVRHVTSDQEKLIRETLSHIEFKHSLDEDWKVCSVLFDQKPIVQMEPIAVARAIPKKYKTYLLWQLGFGDWQQIAMLDNKPDPTTLKRVEGLQGAYRIFEQKTGISVGQARNAWETGLIPAANGLQDEKVSAKDLILQCTNSYFNTMVGSLLNEVDKNRDRIEHIILSGGSSKNKMVVDVIRQAVESEGLKLHLIESIMKKDELGLRDASYATIEGLQHLADLCIDVGNNYIKLGARKK